LEWLKTFFNLVKFWPLTNLEIECLLTLIEILNQVAGFTDSLCQTEC